MMKRLNGWAPWLGIAVTVLSNFVALTMYISRLNERIEHIAYILQDGKRQREDLTKLVIDMDKRVTKIDTVLTEHIKIDVPLGKPG